MRGLGIRVALVVGVTAAAIATATISSGAQTATLQRGVIYDTDDASDQEVSLYALAPGDDGTTFAVVEVIAACDSIEASATVVAEVDAGGAFEIATPVRGTQEEDVFIDGRATVRGQVQPDGTITGTLDVRQAADDDPPCTAKDAPWTATPSPEPSLERIDAYAPAPPPFRRYGAAGLVAGDGALFATRNPQRGGSKLTRIDPTTGEASWTVSSSGLSGGLAFGQGLVWMGFEGSDGDAFRSYDPRDGKPVTTVKGSWIAFAPDGTGWTVRDGGGTLRRIDAESHEVSDEYDMDAKLQPSVTANDDAVYVQRRAADYKTSFEVTVTRVDAASGEVTTELPPEISGVGLAADPGGAVVWYLTEDAVARLDATTLQELARVEDDQASNSLVGEAVAPGLWFDDGNVHIYDEALAHSVIPGLWGPLAPDGSRVWTIVGQIGIVGMRTG